MPLVKNLQVVVAVMVVMAREVGAAFAVVTSQLVASCLIVKRQVPSVICTHMPHLTCVFS